MIRNLFRNGVRSDGLAPVLVEKHNPLIRLVPKSIEYLLFSLKIRWKGNPSSGALASVAPRALIPGLRARAPWCVAGGSGSPCRLGPLGASFSPAGGVAVPLFSAPLTPFLFTLGDSEGGFAPAGCFFRGGIEAWAGYGSGAPASVAPRGLFPGLRARAPGCGVGGSGSPSRLGPAPFSPRPVVWPARSLPCPFPPPLPPFVRGFCR